MSFLKPFHLIPYKEVHAQFSDYKNIVDKIRPKVGTSIKEYILQFENFTPVERYIGNMFLEASGDGGRWDGFKFNDDDNWWEKMRVQLEEIENENM